MLAEAAAMGVAGDALQALEARLSGEAAEVAVWPENAVSVRLFCSVQTQWRWIAGLGGAIPTGLDYAGVRPVLEAMAPRPAGHARLWEDLRVMEAETLRLMAEERAREPAPAPRGRGR